ncbi:hypothetical protein FRC02_006507 [Tulasnella sp. 418]|nr:hypothetical protein FRC02_006507 [Tulasnella sp. 418]
MKSSIVFSALTLAIPAVMATVPIYYQCGGAAYTGETECDAGYVYSSFSQDQLVYSRLDSFVLSKTSFTLNVCLGPLLLRARRPPAPSHLRQPPRPPPQALKLRLPALRPHPSVLRQRAQLQPSLQLHPQVLPQHCPPPVAIVHLLPHLSLQVPSMVV